MSGRPREPQSPFNVLMVNTTQVGGGAARACGTLREALTRGGDRIHLFAGSAIDDARQAGRAGHWREQRVARRFGSFGLGDLAHPSSFLWSAREPFAAADVLHLHNLHGGYVSLAALPLWGRQKPIVWTLHDFWALTGNCATPRECMRWRQGCGRCPLRGVYPMGQVDRSRLARRFKPRLFAAARPLLVTPSRWLARQVRAVPELARLPVLVIPHPVDCATFRPRADGAALRRRFGLRADAPTVVMLGADWGDALKGGADAVRALRAVGADMAGVQALIVGRRGEELLARTGLPGGVRDFVRDVDVLADAYACGDVCLFPSRAENYPFTVLESLACGTPVVAYAVGGVPEQIAHGRSGCVARDGDADGLAAGLAHFLRSPDAARDAGAAGREWVAREHALERIADAYRNAYATATRRWRARTGRSPRAARGRLARELAVLLGWDRRREHAQKEDCWTATSAVGGVCP